MGLETSTYIDGLVTSNPLGTDVVSKGDDHIRLIKSTIKASFPDVDEAVVTVHNGTAAPASKQTGSVWRDTTNSLWKFWNGSAWITLAVAFNASNSVDVNAGTIDGVTIGGSSAPTVTDLGSVATCDINGGTIDGVTIGGAVAPTVTNIDINGGTVDGVTAGTSSPITELQVDNINVNGNAITSTDSNGDVTITPNGTGEIVLDGQKWPQADGSNTNYLTTNGSGQIAWTTNTVPASEANASASATASASSATASASSATSSASSATASASSATDAQTAQTAAETALDTFDDRMLGAKASNPSVDNDGNSLLDGAMYFNTTNDYMMVYNLANTTWYQLTNTTSDQNNINTVAGISSDVTATAGKATQIGLLGTADAISDMNVLGTSTNVTNQNTLAGISSDITTVSGISANVTTAAGLSTEIGNVSGITSAVSTVSGIASAVTGVNNISSAVSGVNTISSAVSAVNSNSTNINTVSSNISGVNSFADRYRVAGSAPASSLDAGDLYFDTGSDTMKVYGSSGWQNAGSSVNGTSARFTYTISGTPSSVSGSDDNGETLAYDAGYADVYLNGVRLSSADITITSGTTVTFASALTNGDIVDIVGFGTFSVASVAASAITSGTIAEARLPSSALGAVWESKSNDFTAEARKNYFCDTSSNDIDVTLPSGTIGDEIHFLDVTGSFDTNDLTILYGSSKIQGASANLDVAVERAGFTLVYYNATQGWLLKDI